MGWGRGLTWCIPVWPNLIQFNVFNSSLTVEHLLRRCLTHLNQQPNTAALVCITFFESLKVRQFFGNNCQSAAALSSWVKKQFSVDNALSQTAYTCMFTNIKLKKNGAALSKTSILTWCFQTIYENFDSLGHQKFKRIM